MNNELKPCPFCGGLAEVHDCAEIDGKAQLIFSGKFGVHCKQCHVATIPYPDEAEAVAVWNSRVEV